MISIIICSRYSDIPQSLKDNIDHTIGLEYELIIIDNSDNKYSIFSAYNEGLKRAKYPVLCFMHDDILFRTNGWGNRVISHFNDTNIGLIGMLGTHFLPSVPTYWTTSPFFSTSYIQTTEGVQFEDFKTDFFHGTSLVDAVACDGICLFVREELFAKISFDEVSYNGFHFYDMDICMQILANEYRVCICNDIIIEHFSLGSYNKSFFINQNVFFNKWRNSLPISRGINHIPLHVINKLNQLYYSLWEADKTRKSLAYRIGRLILQPIKSIRLK